MKFGLTGQALSEKMFENNGHIHVLSPGGGVDAPPPPPPGIIIFS